MWSVNISVSPCEHAARLGYDDRQINRIVIRMAQYFLDHDMRVIFGHDWREDGVMRAVADFAGTVATRTAPGETPTATPRMLNVVPVSRVALSNAAIEAQLDSGGVLEVTPFSELAESVAHRAGIRHPGADADPTQLREWELTALRHWLTELLAPGCRICLGGRLHGFQGQEPGVKQEARLALAYHKPLYLMGGFGGAAKAFAAEADYRHAWNGLYDDDKSTLFMTTDIEQALRLISQGIRACQQRDAQAH